MQRKDQQCPAERTLDYIGGEGRCDPMAALSGGETLFRAVSGLAGIDQRCSPTTEGVEKEACTAPGYPQIPPKVE